MIFFGRLRIGSCRQSFRPGIDFFVVVAACGGLAKAPIPDAGQGGGTRDCFATLPCPRKALYIYMILLVKNIAYGDLAYLGCHSQFRHRSGVDTRCTMWPAIRFFLRAYLRRLGLQIYCLRCSHDACDRLRERHHKNSYDEKAFAKLRRSSAHLRAADQYRIAVIWRGEVINCIGSDGNMKMT